MMLPPLKPEIFELSVEQQFKLRQISLDAGSLTLEQASEIITQLTSQNMVQQNIIKYLAKNH